MGNSLFQKIKKAAGWQLFGYVGDTDYLPKRALSFSSMSRVIVSRSYSGFQPHSRRAQESSREFGHESAIC